MKKDELLDIIGESQDGGAKTLKEPNEVDFIGKFINNSIEDADEVIDVLRDIEYAIDQLNKAKAIVDKLSLNQVVQ